MKQVTLVNEGAGTRIHKGGQDYHVPRGRTPIETLAEAWSKTREEAISICQEYVLTQIAGTRLEVKSPEPPSKTPSAPPPPDSVEIVDPGDTIADAVDLDPLVGDSNPEIVDEAGNPGPLAAPQSGTFQRPVVGDHDPGLVRAALEAGGRLEPIEEEDSEV